MTMKTLRNIITVAAILTSSVAMAQNLETSYFVEGNLYRHQLNPALADESTMNGYVSFPALGNINEGIHGTLGAKDLFFAKNGKTVSFLHPSVTKEEFMKNIKDENQFGDNFKLQILGVGFKGFQGYNTIEVSVRGSVEAILPGTLFEIAKTGLTNRTYDISALDAHADAYAEIALGHSHKINDKLRIGAKLKVLLGGGNLDLDMSDAHLELGTDGKYKAIVNGQVQTSVKGLQYKENKDGNVDDVKVDGAGLNGFGLALDLGGQYKINDNISVSAALLDLGYISWSNNMVASTKGNKTFDMSDFAYDADKDGFYDSKDRKIEDAWDDFKDVYQLKSEGDKGSRSTGLAATMNIGVEYKAPFYDKLSFGLLNTTRMNGDYSWTDFRLSANVAPTKSFAASASLSAGTFGVGFGWLLDLHTKGFGLFLGMDRMVAKTDKNNIPLTSNMEVNFGVNFPF